MPHPLETCLLRILAPDGKTVGAGFVLAPELAVTCSHVIRDAGGAAGEPIRIEYYVTQDKQDAQVLIEGWSPPEQDDLAFLRLPSLPKGIDPAALGQSEGRLGRDYAAPGFPQDYYYRVSWALAKLGGPVPAEGGRSPLLQLQGREIEKGMSGAPVLDLAANQVVGMVCESKDRSGHRYAYAVSTATIQAKCPQDLPIEPDPPSAEGAQQEALALILEALKELGTAVQVQANPGEGGPRFTLAAPGFSICLMKGFADSLLAGARPGQDARRREQVYLARFILDDFYSRWEREYLPLSGRLSEPSPWKNLRYKDPQDQGLSQAGEKLADLRDAILIHKKTRLVILGEPGCGKTTTLERLALDLARQRLSDPQNAKIPLRVDLELFDNTPPNPDSFLRDQWQKTGLSASYDECILAGEVCFLLDGVNQMPFADRPDRVDRWRTWCERLPAGNWALFTCRWLDYQTRLSLPEVHVQQLDAGDIQRYLEIRLADDPTRRKKVAADLAAGLRCGDHRFTDLACNIFWLTLLVERAIDSQPLSGNRADLMEDLVRRRLDREFERMRQPAKVRRNPESAADDVQLFLRRLAYQMQAGRGATALGEEEVTQEISLQEGGVLLDLQQALKLALDSSLLKKKKDARTTYSFYHHLLHEYFAGQELLRRFKAGEELQAHWRVAWQAPDSLPDPLPEDEGLPPPPVTGWEETTRMAAAQAGADLGEFIRAVAACNLPLAGRCLAEAGEQGVLAEDFRARLLERQRSRRAHLRARIDAGLALGELGHPDLRPQPFSFEGETIWAVPPRLEPVAAGPFLFGSSRSDPYANPNEYTDPRQIELPAFEIGRYPLTNAEYRWFIEAGGYEDKGERWWDEAGREWRQGGPQAHAAAIEDWMDFRSWLQQQDLEQLAQINNWPKRRTVYWKEMVELEEAAARKQAGRVFDRPFDRPAFWDDLDLGAPARPLVGVNWYEARAYCRWLSALCRRPLGLPPERYWEKAARGLDGRAYPWEGGFDKARCNTLESQIYTTTPVGLYPQGAGSFGLYDASGNVWEWCADFYQSYPGGDPDTSPADAEKYRVLRGGSWNFSRRLARCASRYGYDPVYFLYGIGFRLFSPG